MATGLRTISEDYTAIARQAARGIVRMESVYTMDALGSLMPQRGQVRGACSAGDQAHTFRAGPGGAGAGRCHCACEDMKRYMGKYPDACGSDEASEQGFVQARGEQVRNRNPRRVPQRRDQATQRQSVPRHPIEAWQGSVAAKRDAVLRRRRRVIASFLHRARRHEQGWIDSSCQALRSAWDERSEWQGSGSDAGAYPEDDACHRQGSKPDRQSWLIVAPLI